MKVGFGKRTVEFPGDDLGVIEDSTYLLSGLRSGDGVDNNGGSDTAAAAEAAASASAAKLHERVERDGYLYLRNVIPRPKVLKARAAVLRHMRSADGVLDPTAPPDEGRMDPAVTAAAAPNMMGRDGIVRHPDVAAALECPELFRFFKAYFGDHRPVRTFDYKWLRAVGRDEYTGAHMDAVYMNRGSKRLHTVWIPLGDVNVDQGTLVMCSGSNRSEGYARVRSTYGAMDVDRDRTEGWLSVDPLELTEEFGGRWVTGNFAAGDVVIFGMHTLHASTTNLTDRYRLSCDVRFQPAADGADPRWVGQDGTGHTAHGVVRLRTMAEARREWGL